MGSRAPVLRLHHDDGRFRPGEHRSPATEIRRGQRLSVATEIKPGERRSVPTEFQRGRAAENKLPVGTVTHRADPHGRMRAWVKVAEPNIWRLRYLVVWEQHRGALPRGMVVHHLDHDPANDAPENLIALTRAEHLAEHLVEVAEAALAAAKKARAA